VIPITFFNYLVLKKNFLKKGVSLDLSSGINYLEDFILKKNILIDILLRFKLMLQEQKKEVMYLENYL